MLIQKKRLDPGADAQTFLQLIFQARAIRVLNINLEIAALSTTHANFNHFDPVDRLIAATAIHHSAPLVTCDKQLREVPELSIIW